MTRSRWLMIVGCVAGWILFAWIISWFTAQFAEEGANKTGRLAYKPVDDMPSHVDLASLQRSWPDGIQNPDEARRLNSFLRDMEGKAPPPSAAGAKTAAEPEPDLGTLLASADANAGKAKAQVCMSCHDFSAGGPDRIGPNLWQIAGRDIASRPGFAYSAGMAKHPGNWSYDLLFDFLAHPGRTVPGTKMSFAGLRRPEDRAAVIRYLATLGGKPPPFPSPQDGGAAKAE